VSAHQVGGDGGVYRLRYLTCLSRRLLQVYESGGPRILNYAMIAPDGEPLLPDNGQGTTLSQTP